MQPRPLGCSSGGLKEIECLCAPALDNNNQQYIFRFLTEANHFYKGAKNKNKNKNTSNKLERKFEGTITCLESL